MNIDLVQLNGALRMRDMSMNDIIAQIGMKAVNEASLKPVDFSQDTITPSANLFVHQRGITPSLYTFAVLPLLVRSRDAFNMSERLHARMTLFSLHGFRAAQQSNEHTSAQALCIKAQDEISIPPIIIHGATHCAADILGLVFSSLALSDFVNVLQCCRRWYAMRLHPVSWPCSDIDKIYFLLHSSSNDARQYEAVERLFGYLKINNRTKVTPDEQLRINKVCWYPGIFVEIVKLLGSNSDESIQSYCLRILTNIARGTKSNGLVLLRHNGLWTAVIRLVHSKNIKIAHRSTYVIGNVAVAVQCLPSQYFDPALNALLLRGSNPTNISLPLLRGITWALSTLSADDTIKKRVKKMTDMLTYLLTITHQVNDSKVLKNVLHCMGDIVDATQKLKLAIPTKELVESGIFPSLVSCLSRFVEPDYACIVIQLLGICARDGCMNRRTFPDQHLVIRLLQPHLSSEEADVRAMAVWFVKVLLITKAEEEEQEEKEYGNNWCEVLRTEGIAREITHLSTNEHEAWGARQSAFYALSEILCRGSSQDRTYLVELNVIPALCNAIGAAIGSNLTKRILQGIATLLIYKNTDKTTDTIHLPDTFITFCRLRTSANPDCPHAACILAALTNSSQEISSAPSEQMHD